MFQIIVSLLIIAMASADMFSGSWIMKSAMGESGAVSIPDAKVTMMLKEKKQKNEFSATFHAGNTLMSTLTVQEYVSDEEAVVSFSQLPMTRMMAPPEFQPTERFLSKHMPGMTKAKLDSDGNLVLEGDNQGAVFLRGADSKESS